MKPILLVDAANVVGSVPDGWWRDRLGATVRLRDALEAVARDGLPDTSAPRELHQGPVDVVLVVEGNAKATPSSALVRVEVAQGTADDAIVVLVAQAAGHCTVATADRGLRERVTALGAQVIGPRLVRK